MKNIVIFLCILIIGSTAMFAQQQNQQILKPVINYSEIEFCLQLLNNIELRGKEVDALMEIRSIMINELQKGIKEKKQLEDSAILMFTFSQAQNLLNFLQRATLTGAQVERYKRLADAIIVSSKPQK